MEKLGVAIAGCGSIAIRRHAPEYAANPNAKIIGFYDHSMDRARELSRAYGGRVYDSYQALLADSAVAAVSICTANTYHAPMALEALGASKHVLCEKPMAASVEDAEKMIASAESAGRLLMIGHNQRLTRAHLQAREILSSGALGRVLTFKTTFGHSGPEGWSVDKSANTWFFKKDATGMGCAADLGVHKLDLMRWLLEDEFTEAGAFFATLDKRDPAGNPIEVEDNAVGILKTAKGVIGTLAASWTYYGREDNSTVIYATEGVMKIYEQEAPLTVINKDGAIRHYQSDGIQTNDTQKSSGVIDMFVDCVLHGKQPLIAGRDGLQALRILHALAASSKTGRIASII